MSDKIRDAVQHLVVDALTAADLVRSGHRSKALSDRLSQHCSVLSKMLAATPTTAAAPEPAEVYLTLAEEEYEAPIVLRAFASRAEAEAFAQTLRDYQQARPEWLVGDEEPEEVLERDKETRAWMAAHPGGEDAAWRRFFSVIAVPFSVAPTCAAQDGDAQLDAMRRSGLSIDGDNAYKRDLIDCIVGALMLGKQGVNPPPAGHWLEQFWKMARAEGEIQEGLAKALPAAEQPGAAGMPLLHWYAMSFRDAGPNGEPVTASTNIGWPDQLITLRRIQEAKKGALVRQNAVMLACCYLGHATRSQILGKEGEA